MAPPAPVSLPPPERRDRPAIDPHVAEIVEAYKSLAAAQDKRHDELIGLMKERDEAAAEREKRRDEQHAGLITSVGDLTSEVKVLAANVSAQTAKTAELTDKIPNRPLIWGAGAFLALLVLALLGLYAQSRGDDFGQAVDDARRGLTPIAAPASE